MRRFLIPAALIAVSLPAVPAGAAPVSLDAACAQTRTLLYTSGGTNGAVVFAGSRFTVGARTVDVAAGTYGLIAEEGLRRKDQKTALGYLGAPRATVWHNEGAYFGTSWTTSYDQALAQAAGLPDDCAAAAGGLLSQSGDTYTYANVSVDIAEGAVVRWGQVQFRFTPQNVAVPAGQAIGYRAWLKASQAASLDATMRTIARTVAATVPEPTGEAIDELLRASVDPARAVPLKVRTLRSGALIWARNPYSKTYHAWRVYLKSGEPVARRVAG